MISFALMLMTLPSRMAEVRAGRGDRARHGMPSTARVERGGLPESSLDERCSGVCVKRRFSKTRRSPRRAPLQPWKYFVDRRKNPEEER
jgi:hypothetical protein